VVTDAARCQCDSRYIGETCDIDLLFLIAVPLTMVLIVGIYFFMNYRYPKARNTVILIVALTIYNFVTDGLFAFSENPDSPRLFSAYLFFTAIPILLNCVLLARIFVTTIRDDHAMRDWLKSNPATSAAVFALALPKMNSFYLLSSNIFYKEAFSAPFSEKLNPQILIGGLLGNLLEDIPQLIIQSVAASTSPLDTITLLSIAASILTISSGVVKYLIVFLITKFQGKGDKTGYQKQAEDDGEWALMTPYVNMNSDTGEEKELDPVSKSPVSRPAMKWTTKEVVAWLDAEGLSSIAGMAETKKWDGPLLFAFYGMRKESVFDLRCKTIAIEDPLTFSGRLELLFR